MDFKYEKPVVVDDSTGGRKSSLSNDDLTKYTEPIDSVAQKKLVRKCDWHVLPTISLLYLFAFIDRINIGNARIQGLEDDLHMTGNNYNVALLVFFVPYILLEVPSNILIKRIAPSTWLSFIMLCWGMYYCDSKTSYTIHLLTCYDRHYHRLHGSYSKLYWTPSLQDSIGSL